VSPKAKDIGVKIKAAEIRYLFMVPSSQKLLQRETGFKYLDLHPENRELSQVKPSYSDTESEGHGWLSSTNTHGGVEWKN
jgi:hypothetical protein